MISRRNMIKTTAGMGAAAMLGGQVALAQSEGERAVTKGRINQSVCQWCFGKWSQEEMVTICMELVKSKHMHKDYMCDHTPWGVELVKAVGSERFKLLYDIFHMQIMEGDVIQTIRENKEFIAHYHTAGVPGRHEFDD